MSDYHPENERIKRAYCAFLKEAKGLSEPSIDAAAKAIARFEAYTRWKSFKAFHHQQAVGFKRHLATQSGQSSGEPLSKSTLRQTLAALKAFLEWIALQPSFKSHITYTDAAYFRLSRKDDAVAKTGRESGSQRWSKSIMCLPICRVKPISSAATGLWLPLSS